MDWLRTFGFAAALGLGAYAITLMLGAEDANGPVPTEVAVDEEVTAAVDREEAIRRVRGAAVLARFRNLPLEPLDEAEEASLEPPEPGSLGEFSREEARFGFDYLMRRVDATGRKKRRLSQAHWRDVYRTANDTYAALSSELDARIPEEAAELERAHKRLRESLEGLRVRGGKFKQF